MWFILFCFVENEKKFLLIFFKKIWICNLVTVCLSVHVCPSILTEFKYFLTVIFKLLILLLIWLENKCACCCQDQLYPFKFNSLFQFLLWLLVSMWHIGRINIFRVNVYMTDIYIFQRLNNSMERIKAETEWKEIPDLLSSTFVNIQSVT